MGFWGGASSKEPTCQHTGDIRDAGDIIQFSITKCKVYASIQWYITLHLYVCVCVYSAWRKKWQPTQCSCVENSWTEEPSGLHGITKERNSTWLLNSNGIHRAVLCIVAQLCPTLVTPWAVARQAPLSMGFSRQEDWSGLPGPPPGDLPNPGIKSRSPAMQADSLPAELPGKPI